MSLSTWRKALRRSFGTRNGASRRPNLFLILEELEIRAVPSFASVTGYNQTATETLSLSNVRVASFTTATPGDTFAATIDWGDGTTTTGTISSTGPGSFDVTGSHAYSEDGADSGSVLISDTTDSTSVAPTFQATVSEGSFVLSGVAPITLTEGGTFNGVVASITDPGSPDAASNFTATVDWGDGTTDTSGGGNVSITGSGGTFTISGTHTYIDEISNGTINVTVSEPDANFTIGPNPDSITVNEADVLSPNFVTSGTVFENQFVGGVAAAFNDSYSGAQASDFSATFDWGDGTTSSTAAGNAFVSGGNGGPFTVSVAGHSYADEGVYTVNATLTDDSPGTATLTQTGTLTAIEGDALSGTGLTITPEQNQQFTGAVATFQDTGNFPDPNPSHYNATIDWGDGSTTPGGVVGDASGFTVVGSHTYTSTGPFTTSVTLNDNAPGTATAVTTGTANVVQESDLSVTAGGAININEGQPFNGTLATFSDASGDPASNYSAVIQWGDGVTSDGSISGSAGNYTVTGTHTYVDEMSGAYLVTVSEAEESFTAAPVGNSVTVNEGDFGSITAIPINATEGTQFSGAVLTFTDAGNSSQTAGDWTATIDWGDGVTTTGTVSGSTGGDFTVSGSHTYIDEGAFTASVHVNDDSPSTLGFVFDVSATAAEADTFSGTGLAITSTEGTAFSGAVAAFNDSGYIGKTVSDLTATIDWGDGNSSTGTITSDGAGTFTVSGTHTYAEDGSYSTSITLGDNTPGTATATLTGSAQIAENDLALSALAVNTTERATFSGPVGTISDPGSTDTASAYSATIDWGDGTTTNGAISGAAGSFTITGSHSYTEEGSYTITLTAAETGASSTLTSSSTATVAEGDVLHGTGVALNTTEGTPFSGTVATFTDTGVSPNPNAGDFTATISWGDGTTSVGTITGSGSSGFTVSGSHTYTEEGTLGTTVILTDKAPGSASAIATGTVHIAEGDLSAHAAAISGTEGVAFNGTVGTITDTGSGEPAANYTAAIKWGDGSTSVGTVSGSAGNYTVTGSHTYAEEGSYTVTLTASELGVSGTVTSNGTATVAEGDVLSGTGSAISAVEKTGFSGAVATFSNTGNSGNSASDFTATINWGDGSTSAGTVSGSAGSFTVSGSHTYAEDGSYTTSITLADDAPGTATNTVHGTAAVAEADLAATAQPISTTQNQTFSGTVGSFSDAGSSDAASGYVAAIGWGDGTTTTGTISGSAGNFTVSGSHTYSGFGSFTLTLTITETGVSGAAATAVGRSTSNVMPAPLAPGLLAVVPNGDGTFSIFTVGADHSLWLHQDATGWTRIGGAGTILDISAAADRVIGPGNQTRPVVFVVTTSHGLARWDAANGWSVIGGANTIRTISAGRDTNQRAAVFVITAAGDLTEYRSTGWVAPFGARGTIASISASSNDRVYVVTTAGQVMAHDNTFGWFAESGTGFALSIDTVDNGNGQVTIFAVTATHSLFRHDDATGWLQIGGDGSIVSVTGGQEKSGQPAPYVLDAAAAFDSLTSAGWKRLANPGAVRSAAGTSGGRVYVIESDGSVDGFDQTTGFFPLAGPGFAEVG